MIVCLCHRVTETQIQSQAQRGRSRFEELQDTLRVATACGACRDCARTTFEAARPTGIARGQMSIHALPGMGISAAA